MIGDTEVTFNVGATTGDTLDVTITGIPDTDTEGNEFITASIISNAAYEINGAANGDTEFLDLKITDNDAGT